MEEGQRVDSEEVQSLDKSGAGPPLGCLQPVPPSPKCSLACPLLAHSLARAPALSRRSRGSLLHADPGRRRRRPHALRADAGTQALLLHGCYSTSTLNAGAAKSFVLLRLDRLLILIFGALRFAQEPQYCSLPSFPPSPTFGCVCAGRFKDPSLGRGIS